MLIAAKRTVPTICMRNMPYGAYGVVLSNQHARNTSPSSAVLPHCGCGLHGGDHWRKKNIHSKKKLLRNDPIGSKSCGLVASVNKMRISANNWDKVCIHSTGLSRTC